MTELHLRRAAADYLDAAADLAERLGPVGGGRRYPLHEVEAVAGISRSTVRRLWPTVQDLADDAARMGALHRTRWMWHLATEPADRPLAAAIEHAVDRSATTTGVLFRCSIRTARHPELLEDLRRWEGHELRRLERWLATHLWTAGLAPAGGLELADLAIIVAAGVEGAIYGGALEAAPRAGIDPALARRIGRRVARMIHHLVAPGPPHQVPAEPGPWLPPAPDARRREIIDLVIRAAEEAPYGSPGGPHPTRLADPGDVARELGVTRRRVQMVWPTTASQNADVAEHLLRRFRGQVEAIHQRAIRDVVAVLAADASLERDLRIGLVFFRTIDEMLRTGLHEGGAAAGAMSLSLADPKVARRVREELAAWQASQGALFLASLQLMRFQLDPTLDIASYAEAVFGSVIGGLLLGALHPSLLRRRVTVVGQPVSLLALGALALFLGMSEAPPPERPVTWFEVGPA